jgi:hypothetical protein
MKRLIWVLRFSPFRMASGVALICIGAFMLFRGPPVVPAGFPAVPVVWMFGSIPWHLSCMVGGWLILWAMYFDEDGYGLRIRQRGCSFKVENAGWLLTTLAVVVPVAAWWIFG